jgi:hypothetical protein
MEFFKCSIGGVAYGAGITEIERNNAERWGNSFSRWLSGPWYAFAVGAYDDFNQMHFEFAAGISNITAAAR